MENKIFIAIECTGKIKNSEIQIIIYENDNMLNFIFLNFFSSKNLEVFNNCKEISHISISMKTNEQVMEIYNKIKEAAKAWVSATMPPFDAA